MLYAKPGLNNKNADMKLINILAVLALTGCGTYGEPLFLAQMYDRNDGCQQQNWHRYGGRAPTWCGAGSQGQEIRVQAPGHMNTQTGGWIRSRP